MLLFFYQFMQLKEVCRTAKVMLAEVTDRSQAGFAYSLFTVRRSYYQMQPISDDLLSSRSRLEWDK